MMIKFTDVYDNWWWISMFSLQSVRPFKYLPNLSDEGLKDAKTVIDFGYAYTNSIHVSKMPKDVLALVNEVMEVINVR